MTAALENGNDVRVNSWCELCERLYEESWQEALMGRAQASAIQRMRARSVRPDWALSMKGLATQETWIRSDSSGRLTYV